MKVGDLVKLIGSFDEERVGVIVAHSDFSPGWHTVTCWYAEASEELIHWPESQMEIISESR